MEIWLRGKKKFNKSWVDDCENFKFKKDNIVNKLDLVSREEFEVLKALVEKQNLKIEKLSKKTKKVKKS